MLLHKPLIETKEFFKNDKNDSKLLKFSNILTRQAIYNLLVQIDKKYILLPRYLAGGVYKPVIASKKNIIYYDLDDNLEIDPNSVNIEQYNKNDILFYYIHHFGLSINKNLNYIQKLKLDGYFVIDDRSLTLPIDSYKEFSDATVYSLYKLVGLPFGGLINTSLNISTNYKSNSTKDNILKSKMQCNLNFYGYHFLKYLPALAFRVLNKIFGKSADSATCIDNLWMDTMSKIDDDIEDKILKLDFNEISKKRIEIAKIYIENLNKTCLLNLSDSAFTSQALIGFPIIAKNPDELFKQLMKKGIHCVRLTKDWWFDANTDYWNIYKNHLLLPCHHYLTINDIKNISKVVNSSL